MTTHWQLAQGRKASLSAPIIATVLALASGAGCDPGSTNPTPNSVAVRPVVTVLSGNDQTGMAEDYLPQPLVVRVTDDGTRALPNVSLDWRITSGEGDFGRSATWSTGTHVVATTDELGIAQVRVRFAQAGVGTVTASVRGVAALPAQFTAVVAEPVDARIHVSHLMDCGGGDPSIFTARGKPASQVSIPLGAAAEWTYNGRLHPGCRARIVSTTVPPGGESFDSGELAPGETFRFVPKVAGTWHYVDKNNDGGSSLTVTP